MLTKAVVQSINSAGNRCVVWMPLFDTAASSARVEVEALVSIPPGLFGSLAVNDVVFVGFEENALEKPIILGKLYKGAEYESTIAGGAGILDSLKVHSAATMPASMLYHFPSEIASDYVNLNTPKKVADYIKWLEKLFKKLFTQLDSNFNCFKKWAQWQLRAENIEVDDGDLDTGYHVAEPLLYQEEDSKCKICGDDCQKNQVRSYAELDLSKVYPNT